MVGLSVVLEGQKGHPISSSNNNNNIIANNTSTDQELVVFHHTNILLSSSFPISPNNYHNPSLSPSLAEIGATSSSFQARGNDRFSYFHPAPAFLDRCFLCKAKLLPGRDIYMYKGDRGFCSVECRCSHISLDEQSDKQRKTKNT